MTHQADCKKHMMKNAYKPVLKKSNIKENLVHRGGGKASNE